MHTRAKSTTKSGAPTRTHENGTVNGNSPAQSSTARHQTWRVEQEATARASRRFPHQPINPLQLFDQSLTSN